MNYQEKIFAFLFVIITLSIVIFCELRVDMTEIDACIEETETDIANTETGQIIYQVLARDRICLEMPTAEIETETETETVVEETEPDFIPYDFLWLSADLQKAIYEISVKYEFNFGFLIAWAMQESNLNPDSKGDYWDGEYHAFGLYQIQPRWWTDFANEHGLDIYNPIDNCELAVLILSRYLTFTEGDLNKALSLYRHGKTESCVEPDGMTYEQHIFCYLNWIESEVEKIGRKDT